MRQLVICVFMLLVAGAFATQQYMTLDTLWFSDDSPATTNTLIRESSNEMAFHDDTAGTNTLNQLKTGAGATALPLTEHYIYVGNGSNIATGVTKASITDFPLQISGNKFDFYYETNDFVEEAGKFAIKDDAIKAAHIDDNAVGNAAMADNAIGNAEMADNAIGNAEMLDNAIGSAEIIDGSVADGDLAWDYRRKIDNVVVVDGNGKGDYSTIQGAIDSITDSSSTNTYVVLIMPGIYEEQVILSDKSYIGLVGIQPNGAGMTEAQNSGVVITYASSGVGSDLMTLWINGNGTTDLEGIVIANLTVINTATYGTGIAQEALDIGRDDTYPRAHEILIKNCSFYGEQDTVFSFTGNPIFQDCYIEGDYDILSIADDIIVQRCYFLGNHSGQADIWLGYSGDSSFTATFTDCVFDDLQAAAGSSGGVGLFAHNNVTANLYNCTVMPNCTEYTWDFNNCTTCTLNVYSTNGENWSYNMGAGSTFNPIGQNRVLVYGTGPLLEIQRYSNDSSPGNFAFYKERTTGTCQDNDLLGRTYYYMENDASEKTSSAKLEVIATDVSDGTEDADWVFYGIQNGSLAEKFRVANTGTGTFTGGVNAGTATTAGTGEFAMSGDQFRVTGTLKFVNLAASAYINLKAAVIYLMSNQIYNSASELVITTTADQDIAVTKFISTDGKEYLGHDVIRHTVSAGEAAGGNFVEAWSTATMAKVVSFDTVLLDGGVVLYDAVQAGTNIDYNGTNITVNEGGIAWAANDVVTIYVVYEK